jgi:NAD(P)-dependent dehydrogenase (short-subunit alcohol dehydrogenase family)
VSASHAADHVGRHAGRVAIVTGAATGLGRAYAIRMAEEGAAVFAVDRDEPAETVDSIRAIGGAAHATRCDVSSEGDVVALHESIEDTGKPCSILINNAGVSPTVPWADLDFAEWRRVLSINLDSMFLMCMAFSAGTKASGFGRIVNISSNQFGLAIPNFVHYGARKGGVIGFTRALATDLGAYGVTVNAVLPGLTKTESTTASWEGTSLFADMAARQAIHRIGLPDDIAGVVSFLASDDAGWITGQSIVADGGLVRH